MGKLTIQDIAAVLMKKNGFEKREANQFALAMFALIQERIESDQLVKVKGLGTFKIIDVEARESVSVRTGERVTISSHSKVSFTPDATMKELVNKPFSQFETVVLNDGVQFDDIKEEDSAEPVEEFVTQDGGIIAPTEDAEIQVQGTVTPVESDPNQIEGAKDVESEPTDVAPVPIAVGSEPIAVDSDPTAVDSEPIAVDSEPIAVDPEPIAVQSEQLYATDNSEVLSPVPDDEADEEETGEGRPWGRWLLNVLGVVALMALSAWGGYYIGSRQHAASVSPVTVIIHDTIDTAATDTLVPGLTAIGHDEPDAQPAPLAPSAQAMAVEPIAHPAKAVVEEQSQSSGNAAAQPSAQAAQKVSAQSGAIDKYAQKDDRVRLGAYRIVGLDHEVKVQPGQTFYSICRGNLGPDMECYVEVYNDLPRNPQVKVGQVIKIPKLQLKKRRK